MNTTVVSVSSSDADGDILRSLGSLNREVMLRYVSPESLPSTEPRFDGVNSWTFDGHEPRVVRLVRSISLNHPLVVFGCKVIDGNSEYLYSLRNGTGFLTKTTKYSREVFPTVPMCERVIFSHVVNLRSNVLVDVVAVTGSMEIDVTREYFVYREPERFPDDSASTEYTDDMVTELMNNAI